MQAYEDGLEEGSEEAASGGGDASVTIGRAQSPSDGDEGIERRETGQGRGHDAIEAAAPGLDATAAAEQYDRELRKFLSSRFRFVLPPGVEVRAGSGAGAEADAGGGRVPGEDRAGTLHRHEKAPAAGRQ